MERSRYLPSEVVPPTEEFKPQLQWVFGNDVVTKPIADRIGYHPTEDELAFVLAAVQREPSTLSAMTYTEGRRANFESDPVTIFGVEYNNIEIGGYGYHPLTMISGEVATLTPRPLELPSAINYVDSHPQHGETTVIDEEGVAKAVPDRFYFTGAYTREQAIRKVSSNLFFEDELSQLKKPPFIVPIPIALGQFPSVKGPDNTPAYFIASRVPYGGRRHSSLFHYDPFDPDNPLSAAINLRALHSVSTMATGLRKMHNLFGLTHNQPTLSNFLVPSDSELPYLADFSTVYPLSKKRPDLARSIDLSQLIGSANAARRFNPSIFEESALLYALCGSVLTDYLGFNPQIPQRNYPRTEVEVFPFISKVVQRAINDKSIPKDVPTRRSVTKIQTIANEINKTA